jgi:hypothetical protein
MLDAAAKTGYKMSRVIGRMSEIGGRDLRVWKDRQWINPINNVSEPGADKTIDLSWRNKKAGFTEIEPRVWFFTDYYSISPGMVSQAGRGAAYEIAFNDADGKSLSGDASYKLTLPPNVPAQLFWSLTLYEAENASGLATEARRFPSLGSRDKPVQNYDGTIDLYIGPKAPDGKQANWLARKKNEISLCIWKPVMTIAAYKRLKSLFNAAGPNSFANAAAIAGSAKHHLI